MRIPEVRERLLILAKQLRLLKLKETIAIADEIDMLEDELHRRKGTYAPAQSAPMTPMLRQAIRSYKQWHPDESYMKIGKRFNVNTGRVSEALRGKRR